MVMGNDMSENACWTNGLFHMVVYIQWYLKWIPQQQKFY